MGVAIILFGARDAQPVSAKLCCPWRSLADLANGKHRLKFRGAYQRLYGDLGDGGGDARVLGRKVVSVSGKQRDAVVGLVNLNAIAVKFYFVRPQITRRGYRPQT